MSIQVKCYKDGKQRTCHEVDFRNHLSKAGWSLEEPKKKSKDDKPKS